jgi:two-component system, NtrC family, sensor kinase
MPGIIKSLRQKGWFAFLAKNRNEHLRYFHTFSNYRRIWVLSIIILAITSLTPLIFATFIHYQLIHKSVDSELTLKAERLTSNAKRSICFFMEERLDALRFIVNEIPYDSLVNSTRLAEIFTNLKLGFGGLTDLSIIDADGNQVSYAGPFDLEGKNYSSQEWFSESLKKNNFVSEVFTGYRDIPHIIIAVRSFRPDGQSFLLRATLDTQRLMDTLLSYKTNIHTDILLMNHKGILQTPSGIYGKIFTSTGLEIPEFSTRTKVKIPGDDKESPFIMSYSYINTNVVETPFILMVQKKKFGVMGTWVNMEKKFNWIIGINGIAVIIIIILVSSFMVNKLYYADRSKAETMLRMEQSQQLASIGQLAAGIAHEINNPLALINETTGYLKDLYHYTEEEKSDEEVIEHLDVILETVFQCGTITSQLLGFVRQFDVQISEVDIEKLIVSILNFRKKETEYKGIHVSTNISPETSLLETDKGKLQQILMNLINNAFQSIEANGYLSISVNCLPSDNIKIEIKDTGCGISAENLNKINEPFFTTKKEKMGTGLGLSITYGLVKKLHGNIRVESTEGVGTIFTLTLPVNIKEKDIV